MNIKAIAAALSVTASLFVAPAQAQTAPAAKAAPAADAKKPHPCIAQVKKERVGYKRLMDEGIKSGKIDKKERADLMKTHSELLAMERKAAEDKKMSREECKAIHDKIVAEHAQLMKAMDRPVRGPAKKS